MSHNIFITSDWHFFHNKSFIYEARGFESIYEMNQKIIDNYNSLVHDNDIVYVLGDCCLGNIELGIDCIKQLKGQKYLAYGNHCTDNKIALFKQNNLFENIQFGYRLKYHKIGFWLTHYPMIMNNYNDKPLQINLSGHTHTQNPFLLWNNKIYNIGMDAHNCAPVSIDEIIEDMKNKVEECKALL